MNDDWQAVAPPHLTGETPTQNNTLGEQTNLDEDDVFAGYKCGEDRPTGTAHLYINGLI